MKTVMEFVVFKDPDEETAEIPGILVHTSSGKFPDGQCIAITRAEGHFVLTEVTVRRMNSFDCHCNFGESRPDEAFTELADATLLATSLLGDWGNRA